MTRTQLKALLEYVDARIVELIHAHEAQSADVHRERQKRTEKAKDSLQYEFLNDWIRDNEVK